MEEPRIIDLAGRERSSLTTTYGSRLQVLERTVVDSPTVQAWTRYTEALVQAGDLARAAVAAQALQDVEPAWDTLLLRSRALALADPPAALALARQAARSGPSEYRAQLHLARCELAAGDPDGTGLRAGREAVRLSGRHWEALVVQGELLRLRGLHAQADNLLGRPRQGAATGAPCVLARPTLPGGARGEVALGRVVSVLVVALLVVVGLGLLGVSAGALRPAVGLAGAALMTGTAAVLVSLRRRTRH